jgi:hypothetical protein
MNWSGSRILIPFSKNVALGQSVGGVQGKNSNMEEENEDYEIQKPKM